MFAIIKFLLIVLLFYTITDEINSLKISSQKTFDVLDISRSELSKILGKKQLRTTRKLVSGKQFDANRHQTRQNTNAFYPSVDDSKDKVLQKMVLNFTDNSMKLGNNVTQIALKVDQTLGTESAIHKCEKSLLSTSALKKNIDQIRDICSVIYSVYCGINCKPKIIKT